MSLPSPKATASNQGPHPFALTTIYALVVLLMANLNAIVDSFIHPDIGYFNHEHLIVGAISAIVSGMLIGIVEREFRYLRKALDEVRSLESMLPICSFCKKIREPGGDPKNRDSWMPIENYISERTFSEFTHGICPDCMSKFFPTDTPRT